MKWLARLYGELWHPPAEDWIITEEVVYSYGTPITGHTNASHLDRVCRARGTT
jgi:hypothetical protein